MESLDSDYSDTSEYERKKAAVAAAIKKKESNY
jgi:hypothetical protein